ncbi:MAG: ABC transporter C-terminal domain-containing protein [Bacteroidales bacterium]|nr:ABC transporter C-terminal domain-containing protein [Bacteroidales bacterium]
MRYILFTFLLVFSCGLVSAQEKTIIDTTEYNKLLKRIEKLEAKLESKDKEDELASLLEDADMLSDKEKADKRNVSKKFHSGVRQQQGLNPNISVLGDFFASASSVDAENISEPGDRNHGSNGLFMRSLEMSFVSALDPFARGKAFLDITEEGVSIEEAYMEILNLPLNTSLKAGVFFPEFGLLNRHHTHALPQFDRPRAAVNYFGLDGFNGMGGALNIMLPRILFSDASSFDISVININDNMSYSSDKSVNMAYVAHWKNYYDISDASYFEYTLSGIAGRDDNIAQTNTYVTSLGLHYKWQPPGTAKYKSFDWMTELYYGFNETPFGIVRSKGFYSLVHRKINSRMWIGGRVGYSEMPYDNSQYEWDYTVNFDFWQSEFVFYRIQYQYNSRSIAYLPESAGAYPSHHSVVLQFSWAMGPHKHDAY